MNEEMTKEDLIKRIEYLESELKKSKESFDFWFKKSQETENKLNALLSIISGILTILEQ